MLKILFLLPFADSKSLLVSGSTGPLTGDILAPLAALAVLLAAVFAFLWLTRHPTARRRRPRHGRRATPGRRDTPGRRAKPKNWIVVDGSNVMHWQDNTPQLAPLLRVVEDLKARGFAPGVVFDANAGWKLFGKYLNERDLGRMMGLPTDQVLVVPKGTQADPYILDTARKFKARIVTNDRYRDWAEAHPEVAEPGFLVSGAMQDGKLWLKGMGEAAKQGGRA